MECNNLEHIRYIFSAIRAIELYTLTGNFGSKKQQKVAARVGFVTSSAFTELLIQMNVEQYLEQLSDNDKQTWEFLKKHHDDYQEFEKSKESTSKVGLHYNNNNQNLNQDESQ